MIGWKVRKAQNSQELKPFNVAASQDVRVRIYGLRLEKGVGKDQEKARMPSLDIWN